jgi:hypothetical protein
MCRNKPDSETTPCHMKRTDQTRKEENKIRS